MVATIRLILLIAGTLIIAAILFDGLRRKKKKLTRIKPNESGLPREMHQRVFHEEILGLRDEEKDDDQAEWVEERVEISVTLEELPAETIVSKGSREYDSAAEALTIPGPLPPVDDDGPRDRTVIFGPFSMEKEAEPDRLDLRDSFSDESEIAEEGIDAAPQQKYISIRIMPEKGKRFGGYELLRAILAQDLHYGEKKLFHRYVSFLTKQKKLFSLASLTDPGDFDLGHMKAYQCDGLIFYTNTAEQDDPVMAFEEMLRTAQRLARSLNGHLMASQKQPWTIETTEKIRTELT